MWADSTASGSWSAMRRKSALVIGRSESREFHDVRARRDMRALGSRGRLRPKENPRVVPARARRHVMPAERDDPDPDERTAGRSEGDEPRRRGEHVGDEHGYGDESQSADPRDGDAAHVDADVAIRWSHGALLDADRFKHTPL